MRDQCVEEIELACRQGRDNALGIDKLAFICSQNPRSKCPPSGIGRAGGARLAGAPQDGLDPSLEFARGERLGHIIIRADLQTEHPVHFLGPSRQQNEGNPGR